MIESPQYLPLRPRRRRKRAIKSPAAAPAGSWSEQLRDLKNFPVIWSLDDADMRTVTGSNVDALLETGGDTRFDLAYVSGTKPTVGTRDDVTVIKENAASVVFRAGASGTLANLWPSGKGTVYVAGWFKYVAFGSVFFRSGDDFTYGFEISTAGLSSNVQPRAYLWDGGAPRTALSPDNAGEGWHQLCVKVDGTNLTLYVDGVQKAQVASGGGVGYLAGIFRLFYQSIGHEIAVMAFGADNEAHGNADRLEVEDLLRDLIPALP